MQAPEISTTYVSSNQFEISVETENGYSTSHTYSPGTFSRGEQLNYTVGSLKIDTEYIVSVRAKSHYSACRHVHSRYHNHYGNYSNPVQMRTSDTCKLFNMEKSGNCLMLGTTCT